MAGDGSSTDRVRERISRVAVVCSGVRPSHLTWLATRSHKGTAALRPKGAPLAHLFAFREGDLVQAWPKPGPGVVHPRASDKGFLHYCRLTEKIYAIYIYIYIHTSLSLYIYIYICTYRERESVASLLPSACLFTRALLPVALTECQIT